MKKKGLCFSGKLAADGGAALINIQHPPWPHVGVRHEAAAALTHTQTHRVVTKMKMKAESGD